MKTTLFFLFALCAVIAATGFAECQTYPCSLYCRMIDWVDAPGASMIYGQTGDGEYWYSGTYLWDLAMGESILVWLPGSKKIVSIDPYNTEEIDTTTVRDYGSEDMVLAAIDDTIIYIGGGGSSLVPD